MKHLIYRLTGYSRLTLIFIFSIVLPEICTGQFQWKEINIKNDGNLEFLLDLHRPEFVLGESIPFTLSLVTKTDQKVYSLDTAHIRYTLETLSSDGGWTFYHASTSGGKFRAARPSRPNSPTGLAIFPIQQEIVILKTGHMLEKQLSLFDVLKKHITPEIKKYKLSVTYENTLKTAQEFTVIFDFKKSIPLLIDMIDTAKTHRDKLWARNVLYLYTGQPEWKPQITDQPEKIQEEVKKLRQWWAEHKTDEQFSGTGDFRIIE